MVVDMCNMIPSLYVVKIDGERAWRLVRGFQKDGESQRKRLSRRVSVTSRGSENVTRSVVSRRFCDARQGPAVNQTLSKAAPVGAGLQLEAVTPEAESGSW